MSHYRNLKATLFPFTLLEGYKNSIAISCGSGTAEFDIGLVGVPSYHKVGYKIDWRSRYSWATMHEMASGEKSKGNNGAFLP